MLDWFICKWDAQAYFWAGFVMNLLSRLHIFTEIIYVPVPHVKYCTRFIMLTSSWLACNKMWYCEKAHWFCNYFIICHEDHHHLLGFWYVVCFLWQNISDVLTEMRDQFYVNRSLTILSTQLWFTSQYVNYSHLQLIESKKVLFNMANVYQRPPIRVCLKYLCADLI